ncbi:MAG TPA: rhodanese-like domain-containing protein, partial [Pyrinomonadaceae bacterium]|nr:rhodanese-like domain-containing protein [Pyrinomonadaceae bacterium]
DAQARRPSSVSPPPRRPVEGRAAQCESFDASLVNQGHAVLDVRSAAEFGAGHVPGSVNIGLGGQFASWAGTLLQIGTPLILVADAEEKVDEAVTRLARVGHENVRGYLRGGAQEWRSAGFDLAVLPQVTVEELRRRLEEDEGLQVLDVRRPAEFAAGHVPRAVSTPLSPRLREEAAPRLDPARPVAVVCAGGYRSSAAASLLKRHGLHNLLNVAGGTGAWVAAGFPVEKPSGAN